MPVHLYGYSCDMDTLENLKIKHDLSKSPILKLNKKIDFFIHVAGRRMSEGQKTKEYINSNVLVSYNLQKMIKKFKPKLTIYTSSRSIYGEVKTHILKESTNILNPDVYGQTKLLGEKILEEAGHTISLRLSTVLSKGAPGWIAKTYENLLLGKKIKMINTKINNFVHISDVFNVINFFFKKKMFFTDQFNISCSKITDSKKLTEKDIEKMSPMALNDPCTSGNPKKTTLEDMKKMYQYSMEGKLF